MGDIQTSEVVPTARFEFFTDVLKAGGGDGEPMTLSGVASSTVEDLHGDRIERSALKDMEVKIANGMTMFLNHSYKVPEDVAGYAQSARVTRRGEDKDGNAIWDLDLEFTVNDENPRAVEAWKGIHRKKWKAGISIGANIPPGGYEVDRKSGAKTIKHLDLLEASIVGIPANQRSWIAKAITAIEKAEATQELEPEELEAAPPADDRDAEPETSPDQPDASIRDDSEPEAVSSDPGPEEGESADPSEVASLEGDTDAATVLESLSETKEDFSVALQSAVELGLSLAGQVIALRKERDEAVEAAAEAERERQETMEKAARVIATVSDIVQAVGDMPLGRKTVIKEQASKVQHLESVYGAEFMKMLETNHHG